MEQRIEPLAGDDAQHVEKQRTWVRDHYAPEARQNYETVEGKLRLVNTILQNKWIAKDEKWKLQSLGIAFGDALSQGLGMTWVTVEDEYGRDPALQDNGTSIVVFPLTAISKRVERGEDVDVHGLFKNFREMVEERRKSETSQ